MHMSILGLLIQPGQSLALTSAVEEIQKGNYYSGLLITVIGGFYFVLGFLFYLFNKKISAIEKTLEKLRDEQKKRDNELHATSMTLSNEGTKAMTAMSLRGADLKGMMSSLSTLINDLKLSVAILVSKKNGETNDNNA